MSESLINAILVDDEPRGLSALQKLLEQNCPQVNVLASCRDADMARHKIKEINPQLVFMDISMPGKNGFDLLDGMPAGSFEIIFITAHSTYAINAFKYDAVDYLLKPVDELLLVNAVKKAGRQISLKQPGTLIDAHPSPQKSTSLKGMKLCVPSLKGFCMIDVSDVLYCEAQTSYTTFHMAHGTHIVSSKPIIDYELLLESNSFFRVHKSFLVNLAHVKEYIRGDGGSIVLSNGVHLAVSRRKKDSFIYRVKDLFGY